LASVRLSFEIMFSILRFWRRSVAHTPVAPVAEPRTEVSLSEDAVDWLRHSVDEDAVRLKIAARAGGEAPKPEAVRKERSLIFPL